MGHFIFIVLHFIALLFGAVLLFVTIPLHIIYAVVSKPKDSVNHRTHDRCPYCQEFVHREASICPHCRQALTPESEAKAIAKAAKAAAKAAR